jgi:hypothetical protein
MTDLRDKLMVEIAASRHLERSLSETADAILAVIEVTDLQEGLRVLIAAEEISLAEANRMQAAAQLPKKMYAADMLINACKARLITYRAMQNRREM